MKPAHYYRCTTSGRFVFTRSDKGSNPTTRAKQQVLVSSIRDWKLSRYLKGKKCELNRHQGVIKDCLSMSEDRVPGPYRNSRYTLHPELLQFNHFVRVYWYTGLQPVWQPLFKLELI